MLNGHAFSSMWMISRGARNFIYLSRSAADKPEAAELVSELDEMSKLKKKLDVHVVRGDVSKREDVARAIAVAKGSPIKGVVQAAMVLKVGAHIRPSVCVMQSRYSCADFAATRTGRSFQ